MILSGDNAESVSNHEIYGSIGGHNTESVSNHGIYDLSGDNPDSVSWLDQS